MVRILWKPLQIWGISDPTSPAKNYMERIKLNSASKWIENNGRKITIVGHASSQFLPIKPKFDTYFNDGSCVHPRSITGIEIVAGTITLINGLLIPKRWHFASC
jgi:hypothetical protein